MRYNKKTMNFPKIPFVLRLTLVIIAIIGLGYLIKLGQSILAPFFLAFLLAMLFVPFANFLEQKLKFPRSISSLLSVAIMIGFFAGLGYFFGIQLSSFSQDIPQLEKQILSVFKNLQTWISETFNLRAKDQFKYLNQGLNKLLSSSGIILEFTFGIFSASIAFFAFCILFFVLILNYRRILYNFIINVFDDKHSAKVKEIVDEIQTMTKKYITGLCIQIVIVSTLASTMLTIIGIKYAILLGILTGILNVIPYIGVFFSMLISCFMAFATGLPSQCLYVILGYVIVHAIDGNIILPFVVGSKVKINALFSFLGILIGEHLWGISGMFLCIPTLAILKIIFERVDNLKPWGGLLSADDGSNKKKKSYKISKTITLEEKD